MLIDFHTHTSASDGALDPCELVARALASDINLLAITDHDTVAGYEAAAAYHREHPGGMRLIPGIELSCQWSGTTIHILGLGIDCEHPAMRAAVAQMDTARQERGAKQERAATGKRRRPAGKRPATGNRKRAPRAGRGSR